MKQTVKLALTAALVAALIWPFFWGRSASTEQTRRHLEQKSLIYNTMPRHELLW
jgi:hypothetical protein